MKNLLAYAIVNKLKPKLSLQDIYSKEQIAYIKIDKGEKIIRIEIREIK